MTEQSNTEQQLPQCKCGHTRKDIETSVHVTATSEYSGLGWFFILFGITAKPKAVVFRCTQCSQTIEVNTDPAILKKYA